MSNLNNCCGDSPVYNVATPIPGPAGASAYIYVAFADDVIDGGNGPSSGNPSHATVNFQLDYPTATSDWFAIITSNVPLSPPVLADFDGYWVPLTGVILSGINLEDDGVAVPNGPFTTVNFQGSGLTGVTVTDNGSNKATVEIVTAGLIKTHFTAFQALAAGNSLVTGASYWIVDIGDGEGSNGGTYQAECSAAYYANFGNAVAFQAYPHNTGIIVRAVNTSTIDPHGIYLARVPNINTTQWFMPGTSYVNNAPVASYNQVFTNSTGGAFIANTEPADTPASWTFIPRDNLTHYTTEVQGCYLDLGYLAGTGYPAIRERWDNKNNRLKLLNLETDNEFIKKIFRWGVNTISNNTIYFFEDISKRAAGDPLRSPAFNTNGQLMNYSNVQNFNHNKVDNNASANNVALSSLKTGTRFFKVYMNSQARFYGNVLDNAVVANITSNAGGLSSAYNYVNNVITDSVLNNFACINFFSNTLSDNTVLGDINYLNTAGNFSSDALLDQLTFNNLTNDAIIYNLGCKTWTAAGDNTSDIVSIGGGVQVDLFGPNSTTGAAIGDFVQFIAPSPANILNSVHVVATTPSGSVFTIADPTIPNQTNTIITCRFYYPSIATSFSNFKNNTINRSVIRGINKTVAPTSLGAINSTFQNNVIDRSFFENYVTHTPANGAIGSTGYNEPGTEYSGALVVDNRFVNTVFVNNRVNNYIMKNIFQNTAVSYNNPQSASGGITNGGFAGQINSNVFEGGGVFNDVLNWNGGANGLYGTSSITVKQNSFIGIFQKNYVGAGNVIFQNVIQTGGFIADCIFKGHNVIGNPLFGPTNNPGLSGVTVNTNATLGSVTFEGAGAGLNSLTWVPTNDAKQLLFNTGLVAFTVRDQKISGANKSSVYKQVLPALALGQVNQIRDITVVSTTPIPLPIGTITYTRAEYTIEVTTQAPHLLTSITVGDFIDLFFRGFPNINIVTNADETTGVSYPNGIYKTINSSAPYPYFVGFSCFGSISSIIDEYKFQCTISQGGPLYQFTNGWLLDPTNVVLDSLSNPSPGNGLAGAYSDADDIYGRTAAPWWPGPFSNPNGTNSTLYSTITTPITQDPIVRISINNSFASPPPTPTGSSRKFYQFKDWNEAVPSIKLYDPVTNVLTLPHFFDLIGCTVLLGGWGPTATVYEIDQIRDMPNDIPIKFVTSPGTKVQFNTVSVTAPVTIYPSIIRDSAALSYTITSYYNSPIGYQDYDTYDEIILMRQGPFIKIISKIINQ